MFVHSSKALLFSGFGFDQHMQKELIVFSLYKVAGLKMSECTHRRPAGAGAGVGGGWPRGTRNDRTTTKQPRAQSSEERETEKGSKQTPVLKDPEKICGLFLQKENFLFILFFLIKTYQNW